MKIKNLDLKNIDKKLKLAKILPEEIKIISIDDIWDGPLAGVCQWEGKDYYFHCFDQLEDDNANDRWPRKYILIKLTKEQSNVNEKQRSLFSHFLSGSMSREDYLQSLEELPSVAINMDQIVGWFDSGDNNNRFMKSYLELKEEKVKQ